jgi:hypothetical protein
MDDLLEGRSATPGAQEQPTAPMSLDDACRELGELLGLRQPVSHAVLAAATERPTYAHNLLAARGFPDLLRPLLEHPPETPRQPSAVSLAAKAAGALVRWGATGFTIVDAQTLERRRAACESCPHLMHAQRHPTLYRVMSDGAHPQVCGMCGCPVARKVRLSSERCPAQDERNPGLTRWGEPVKDPRAFGDGRQPTDS